MNRQQDFQGGAFQQHNLTQQYVMAAQTSQAQINLWEPYQSRNYQSQRYQTAQQPGQQLGGYYGYSCNQDSLNITNGFDGGNGGGSSALADIVNSHGVPTQVTHTNFTQTQWETMLDQPMTFTGTGIIGNAASPAQQYQPFHQIPVDKRQGPPNYYNNQFRIDQQPYPTQPASRNADMLGSPINITTTLAPAVPTRENTSHKTRFYTQKSYRPARLARKGPYTRQQPRDTHGIDLAEISKPKTTKFLAPTPKIIATYSTPAAEIATPQLSHHLDIALSRDSQSSSWEAKEEKNLENAVMLPLRDGNPDSDGDLGPLAPIKKWLDEEQQAEANLASTGTERGTPVPPPIKYPVAPSGYPIESCDIIRLPGCQFRAQGICVGTPSPRYMVTRPAAGIRRFRHPVVYGVRGSGAAAGGGVVFRAVGPGCTVEEIMSGTEIELADVVLNDDFADMRPDRVVRWVAYLLAAVPGFDDATTRWGPAAGAATRASV
ncbi:hypothetical protein GGS24DRAFT_511065 [Hypoxylon argillaceum]|nr:hypothetical protein GGS24DRAFT_511065 [Hypoxylon argillaceum]